MSRAVPSRHGEALGRELARLAEKQAATHPDLDERCLTCAFREGSMTSKMAPTVLEAMNCVVGADDAIFGCHHGLENGNPTKVCAGYILCMSAEWEDVKAAVARGKAALDALEGDETTDAAFVRWRAEHDPDDKMDDYKRAREYAKFQSNPT